MSSKPNRNLTARVAKAATRVLQRNGHLTYPLLLIELGILAPGPLQDWHAGRVPYLEKVIQSNLTKLSRIQKAVRRQLRHARRLHRPHDPLIEKRRVAAAEGADPIRDVHPTGLKDREDTCGPAPRFAFGPG